MKQTNDMPKQTSTSQLNLKPLSSKQESYKIASSGFKRHFAKTESIPLKILASLYSVNGSAP
jgi:hypothetical protein